MSKGIHMKNRNVLQSPFGDVTVPEGPLHKFVLDNVARFGDKVAMEFVQAFRRALNVEAKSNKLGEVDTVTKRQYTYSEFHHSVRQAAAALYRHGVRKGDIVLIVSPNDIEYGVAVVALISLGAIVSTVNPASTPGELGKQLADSNACFIIAAAALNDMAKEVAKHLTVIKEIFTFGDVEGCTSFAQLIQEGGPEPPEIEVDVKKDVVVLPYSSGTTGTPKGVMLTHYNIMANFAQCDQPLINIDSGEGMDTYLAILPFFHVYGLGTFIFWCLARGQTVAVSPKFGLLEFLTAVQEYKATILHIVPPIAVLLTKHPIVDQFDLSSVRQVTCGAAPMTLELEDALQTRLKVSVIRQGYGMTEVSTACHISPVAGWKHGSVGWVLTGTECRVVNDQGENLGPNEDGEICVRGPQVMKGYYGLPEATAETIDSDGWLHTGDIGHYDDDGHFFLVDRLKELIKYKGFQVAPAELEGTLLTHPAVADACVVSILDDEAGELPLAYIVKKPDVTVSDEDIIQFIHGRVGPHKRLRGGVQFIDVIPKSPSGKILRRILKEKARRDFPIRTRESTKLNN